MQIRVNRKRMYLHNENNLEMSEQSMQIRIYKRGIV